jgi:Cdc6-like AAA superfamily ATPase
LRSGAAEKVSRSRECLRFPSVANGAKPSVVLGRDRAFAFDHAFGPRSSQSEVYDSCIAPLVQQCFDGYNATCVCYGQTGSGKTFTSASRLYTHHCSLITAH